MRFPPSAFSFPYWTGPFLSAFPHLGNAFRPFIIFQPKPFYDSLIFVACYWTFLTDSCLFWQEGGFVGGLSEIYCCHLITLATSSNAPTHCTKYLKIKRLQVAQPFWIGYMLMAHCVGLIKRKIKPSASNKTISFFLSLSTVGTDSLILDRFSYGIEMLSTGF